MSINSSHSFTAPNNNNNASSSSNENSGSTVQSTSATTVIFTSDALKKIRRGERQLNQQLSQQQLHASTGSLLTSSSSSSPSSCFGSFNSGSSGSSGRGKATVPPEVAPKPKISLGLISREHPGQSFATSVEQQRLMAKSTPALHQMAMLSISEQHAVTTGSSWKNSIDSLDTMSTVSSSSPRDSNLFPQASSSIHATSQSKESEESTVATDNKTNCQATSDNNTKETISTVNNGHCHSNSDSGLSSLSGRTSTMSPVSTMSTVSSVSSSGSSTSGHAHSSGGSHVRNSLRSASIVSQTLTEEDVLGVAASEMDNTPSPSLEREVDEADRGSNDGSAHSADSGTGTLKKGAAALRERKKFQEEIDCEELSKELAPHLSRDKELHVLLGEFTHL